MADPTSTVPSGPSGSDNAGGGLAARLLNLVETLGNKLPDPVTLFVIGALLVPVISHGVHLTGWSVKMVEPAVVDGVTVLQEKGDPITAEPMLTRDSIFGLIASLKDNFIKFPPLALVLFGMLGIGVAEKSGLIGTSLKACMLVTPKALLTPAMVFVGVMSSAGLDAGYIVLPPVAALLYKSVGRSPLAGIAAVFAGVAAGFCANLAVTALDPMLSALSQKGAMLVNADYTVAPTCNWWFAAASTVFLTFIGWAVTARFVEPRLNSRAAEHGGPGLATEDDIQRVSSQEKRGLLWALITAVGFGVVLAVMIRWEDALLHGEVPGGGIARWVKVIVPIIFFAFLLPSVAYGIGAGTIKNDKDVARMMAQAMAAMGPIIVLAFFAGQFIQWFEDSHLGTMLAITGGRAIAESGMPTWAILVAFILLVSVINLFVGSMSAKYTVFAPVFIPMFMIGAGMSPELTQAAYRVGDSCTNIIAPLNAYLIIILVFVQKYDKKAGMGTMIALMLPYSVVFMVTWTAMLLVWVLFGVPLGPEGPLEYVPPAG